MKRLVDIKKEARSADIEIEYDDRQSPMDGLQLLYSPEADDSTHVRDLADVLLELGKIDSQQVSQIRRDIAGRSDIDIEQLIIGLGFAAADDILNAKARLYGFEFRRITTEDVDRDVFNKLQLNYIKNNHVMPIAIESRESSTGCPTCFARISLALGFSFKTSAIVVSAVIAILRLLSIRLHSIIQHNYHNMK